MRICRVAYCESGISPVNLLISPNLAAHGHVEPERLWAAPEPGRYFTAVMVHLTHLVTVAVAASLIKMIERGRYDTQGCGRPSQMFA